MHDIMGPEQSVTTSATDQTQWFPIPYVEFPDAHYLEIFLYLKSISGAPSAASITAKLQKGMLHTTGSEYTAPLYQDYDDFDIANRCLGGQGFGYDDPAGAFSYPRAANHLPATIHDSAVSGGLTLGYFTSVRILHPTELTRVILTPTFTGGTTPKYLVDGYYEWARK